MALITPATSLPAQNASPSGMLTTSNPQCILSATLTGGGAAVLRVIRRNEGGYWYYTGDVLSVNSSTNPADSTDAVVFSNPAQSSNFFVVLDSGSATVATYLSALTAPGTSTSLVAHASTHLAGGADDLLGAPGTVGGGTPGVFIGTFGPSASYQNTVPSVNGDTFSLIGTAQTFSAVKTFSAAPVFGAGATASGAVAFDLSGSTGAQKTTTGAQTIGGGAAAIGITSSAAAITITAGAASTWSTTSGALTASGKTGIALQYDGATTATVGTSALTMAAGKSLSAAAGATGLDFSAATGDAALPTGALSWAGAANKNLSLVAQGTGTVAITSGGATTITGGASSTITVTGALTASGTTGINLQRAGATVIDVGATSANVVTLAAGKSLSGASGAGALSFGSMTGDTALPTGALSWAGATDKSLSLVAQGTGTLTLDGASTWSIGATAGTSGTIGRTGQSVTFPGAVTHTTTLTQTGIATFNAAPALAAGLTASGAVANDFSGSTGAFLTSTGLNTVGGDLLMASGKIVGFGAPQSLSGAGAVNVTTLVTLYTSTGGAQALTLANGTRAGQLKIVCHAVDGGSGVLTPTTPSGFSTLTLTALYDCGVMMWDGSAWCAVLATGSAAFA